MSAGGLGAHGLVRFHIDEPGTRIEGEVLGIGELETCHGLVPYVTLDSGHGPVSVLCSRKVLRAKVFGLDLQVGDRLHIENQGQQQGQSGYLYYVYDVRHCPGPRTEVSVSVDPIDAVER